MCLLWAVENLVPPTRIERATRGLGNRCSIQLSYGGAEAYLNRDESVPARDSHYVVPFTRTVRSIPRS
jgi:hypothetical protein